MKVVLIVLDSVGIGHAPDASAYGDEGAATLPHIGEAVGGLVLPTLQALGLGNIPALIPGSPAIPGIAPHRQPLAHYGVMIEKSQGKDTVTGHWEIVGLELIPGFHLFPPGPPSFPDELVRQFEERTGRGILGNKAASGTGIIDACGAQHMQEKKWIVYTSADSVFQIAAHEEVIPLPELYRACEIARELCDAYRVGRVIARPFIGQPGAFQRTENRRDYAFKPSEPTVLEKLTAAGHAVYAVGKIEDIVAHRGITESNHTGNNRDSQKAVEAFMKKPGDGLIFANFIDFDMIYGHRRDPQGYADSLKQTDDWLAGFIPTLAQDDVLILTADHGNDPTWKGTDHTRETVPLLLYRPGQTGISLGVRNGYYDVAQSIATLFGIDPMTRGVSFIS
ncbi:MAG TPA: phosphopentomutase [Kiritimatiellia bacterium]|nr:phosphopentomutase [Kiritimatiellia bacterium]HMO98414.1 phosphopentomutase [Kiritimatiellia bacterium]HMP96467.1 phosphopentomutase [Kiritimatiellia bacterium]